VVVAIALAIFEATITPIFLRPEIIILNCWQLQTFRDLNGADE